ncbi:MAG: hypothetical protein IPN17_17775 [Deltaproteobacteria bacterium]|nr:hypothetical protein [Deltaproteobacteria bacterium]
MQHPHVGWTVVPILAALAVGCEDSVPSAATVTEVRSSHARVTASPGAADLSAVIRGNASLRSTCTGRSPSRAQRRDLAAQRVDRARHDLGQRPQPRARPGCAPPCGSVAGVRERARVLQRHRPGARRAVDAARVAGEPRPARIKLANALWAQRGDSFQTPFLDTLEHLRRGRLAHGLLDLSRALAAQHQHWVSERTEGRILAPRPGTITPATVFVLTNAIHFIAGWRRVFDPRARPRRTAASTPRRWCGCPRCPSWRATPRRGPWVEGRLAGPTRGTTSRYW